MLLGCSQTPSIAPATPNNQPPALVCCVCVFAAVGVTSTLPKAFGDAANCEPGSRAGLCHFVVVMTYARCKRCPGLRMAGFRKFQQTSCITHKVFIAVEVCTNLPCLFTQDLPFHTRLGVARPTVPKRSATIYVGSGFHCLRIFSLLFFPAVQALSGIENDRFQEVPTDILHHP